MPAFRREPPVQARAGIRREDGKIDDLQFRLENELHRAVENARVIGVEAEHERAVNADAVVVDFFDDVEVFAPAC